MVACFILASVSVGRLPLALAGVRAFASGAREIDYSLLGDRTRYLKSWAREAGILALKGEVPSKSKDGWEVATFAGGCFWGTELHYQRIPGVIATCVGYTQGRTSKPTYEQVCSGTTGHTEACQVIFDPAICSYDALCTKLFDTIDPTAVDRVGNDWGTQARATAVTI